MEESNTISETEPLLLPNSNLAHPADILCTPLSSLEALDEARIHRDSDLPIRSPSTTTTTNDIYQSSSDVF